jgi:alkylation response protein AidB-like acyl-CoA dehydrogenase
VLAPLYEELGRSLAPVSIAATLAAADAIAGHADAGPLLARIAGGEVRFAASFGLVSRGPGTAIGRPAPFLDAADATHLIAAIGEGDAIELRLVDLKAHGVSTAPVETWDRTRTMIQAELSDVGRFPLLPGGFQAFERLRAHLDLAWAWDSLGGAQQALAEAVAYMQTRRQFGRPIGSFQALKHRAADLKVQLEIALALAHQASRDFRDRNDGWQTKAVQAKLLACESYRAIAEENIQFHGGIGFTWEHDCHIFFKRAWLNEALGGTANDYRDRAAPGILRRALAQSGGA